MLGKQCYFVSDRFSRCVAESSIVTLHVVMLNECGLLYVRCCCYFDGGKQFFFVGFIISVTVVKLIANSQTFLC